MNIQNMQIDASYTSGDRVATKTAKIAYGTSAERTGMSSTLKAKFTEGSQYLETDTGKIFVMSSDWVEM